VLSNSTGRRVVNTQTACRSTKHNQWQTLHSCLLSHDKTSSDWSTLLSMAKLPCTDAEACVCACLG
jgi:hypothetical protein